jgi:hypothetical protein
MFCFIFGKKACLNTFEPALEMRLRNLQIFFSAFLNTPELCTQFKVMLALNLNDSLIKSYKQM